MHREKIQFPAGEAVIDGTFAIPSTGAPGVLFLHGWSGSQENDLKRAAEIAGLGSLCLTFNLRGHAATRAMRDAVTPRQNFEDALAAYDLLAAQPMIDKRSIAVIGASYGAYLATLVAKKRPVRWMSMRAPAIYRDQHWEKPKAKIDRLDLKLFRSEQFGPGENMALGACAEFRGDVLIVESELDDYIPHATIANYVAAFRRAHSLTYRVISGADHGLSDESCADDYTRLLVNWVKEMIVGAR